MSNEKENKDLDDQLLSQMRQDFLVEAGEHLDQLNLNLIQLEGDPEEEGLIDEVFRVVHTLKGSSAFVGFTKMSDVSRKMEDVLGIVRKGSFKITAPMMKVMYEAQDILTALIEKHRANEEDDLDISGILGKLEAMPESSDPDSEEGSDKKEADSVDQQELLSIYKESYDQLAALKHIVYSSVHLSDPESLAVLFSKQIDERMSALGNAFWLVEDHQKVVEIARNGRSVKNGENRFFDIESSPVLKRVIHDQLVVWSSSQPELKEMLPEFESPTLFPIKAEPRALGFLVVDPEELAEVEVYQFVGQFAAMILNISKLHHKVEEQKAELDELTEILFKQNAQLASLHHAALDLMKVADPADLCRIIVEAVVSGLEAHKAAAFLIDDASQELVGISQSGGLHEIDSMRLPLDGEKAIKQCIDSGRVISYVDNPGNLHLGPNLLENWVVFSLKGRERAQGVLLVEAEDVDISDPISILVNHAGILLDNLVLQKRLGNAVTGG